MSSLDSHYDLAGPPRSDDAEKGVLSCFLQNPEELLTDAQNSMTPEWFHHAGNRMIFEELLFLNQPRSPLVPIELVSVNQHLIDRGLMDKVGGPSTIATLLDFVPTPAHYTYYKGILQDKFLLRRLDAACRETINQIRTYEEDVATVVTQAEARVFDVLQASQQRGQFSTGILSAQQAVTLWMDHMQEAMRHQGQIRGLTTGLHDLDRTMWGLDDREGEIFTIAARPGQGKTALACSIVEYLGTTGVPTLVFSIEMSLNQILDRIILGGLGIDTGKAQTGMFSRGDLDQIRKRTAEIMKMPLFFDGSSDLSSADVRSKLQTMKRKHGIRAVVVDRLELISPVTKLGQENERMALVEAMKTLQWAKKELHLGIYNLMQMSRESDKKPQGAPPLLADLQGSGSPEQFSEHVGFIVRPCYYKPWEKLSPEQQQVWISGHEHVRFRNPERWSDGSKYAEDEKEKEHPWAKQDYEEHAVIYLRKNRRGATPEIAMRFEPEFTRFSSRSPSLFSGNPADRQVPADAPEVAPEVSRPRAPRAPLRDPEAPSSFDEIFPD
jgi:replicative DNA helicase